MGWFEIGKFVLKKAPILGKLLLGKKGADAGAIIADTLGVPNTPGAVMEALKDNPDNIIKVVEIQENSKQLLERWRLDDIKDARDREIEITKTTGKRDMPMIVVGMTIIVGFFGSFITFLFVGVPKDPFAQQLVMAYAMAVVLSFGTVRDYLFGSSKSSSEKNSMFGGLLKPKE